MSVFTDAELAYLGSQQLGRVATADPDGQPRGAEQLPLQPRHRRSTSAAIAWGIDGGWPPNRRTVGAP